MKKKLIGRRVIVLSVFIVVLIAIVFGISQVLSYLNSGADRNKMLHLDFKKEGYYAPLVYWISTKNEGRALLEGNIAQIEEAYIRAWYLKSLALKSNNVNGLVDGFSAQATQTLEATIDYNISQNQTIEFTSLEHHITPLFFSDDGKIVSFLDRDVRTYSRVFKDDVLQLQKSDRSSYRVTMFLQEGVWRVRHMIQIETLEPLKQTQKATTLSKSIKGINYYPKNRPWDTFNDDFNQEYISNDFIQIKSLGFNTVRVFIGYQDFGGPWVDNSKIERLQKLLDTAQKHDMQVIITLFDFYGNYSLADWSFTQQHLVKIVKAIHLHPALHSWDLKNEPDLDFESRGKALVNAWLEACFTTLKSIDSVHPITIGWSSIDAAIANYSHEDYLSFHYYQEIELLSSQIDLLESKINVTWVLQEIGASSNRGIWAPLGKNQQKQKQFYQAFFDQIETANDSFVIWTLYDFENVPSTVAGWQPWRKNKQANFGLLDVSGAKKKSGEVVKLELLGSH